jgi:acetylglutamate kinase
VGAHAPVPVLFWRSRAGNPINSWYFDQSQGSYRSDQWIVFWYGLSSYDAIRKCVEHALALPPSLQELEPVAAIA